VADDHLADVADPDGNAVAGSDDDAADLLRVDRPAAP